MKKKNTYNEFLPTKGTERLRTYSDHHQYCCDSQTDLISRHQTLETPVNNIPFFIFVHPFDLVSFISHRLLVYTYLTYNLIPIQSAITHLSAIPYLKWAYYFL